MPRTTADLTGALSLPLLRTRLLPHWRRHSQQPVPDRWAFEWYTAGSSPRRECAVHYRWWQVWKFFSLVPFSLVHCCFLSPGRAHTHNTHTHRLVESAHTHNTHAQARGGSPPLTGPGPSERRRGSRGALAVPGRKEGVATAAGSGANPVFLHSAISLPCQSFSACTPPGPAIRRQGSSVSV